MNIISGTGDRETRQNEITADDIATFRQYIVNWESGVIDGFEETHTTEDLTIKAGTMFAYSYFGNFEDTIFHFYKPSAIQYHFIYAEIDRSVIPNTAELKVKNNQSGKTIKPTTFRQDILSAVKTGVYQLPLYRVTLNDTGITTVEDLRDIKTSIKRVYKSNQTHKITKEIRPTVNATTQLNDRSKKIATTMFVHNAIRNYIDSSAMLKVGWQYSSYSSQNAVVEPNVLSFTTIEKACFNITIPSNCLIQFRNQYNYIEIIENEITVNDNGTTKTITVPIMPKSAISGTITENIIMRVQQ